MKFRFLLLLLLALISGFALNTGSAEPSDSYIRADRLGIAHISSMSPPTPEERYQKALMLGAGWNRWPLYWNWVQPEPETWDWTDYDRQVQEDLANGLSINAILLGVPEFHRDGSHITGLNEAIFTDGTDLPGPGKTLNPQNPWAIFAFEAVQRYKPGGTLANEVGLPADQGISIWEVWNEPDFADFWSGTARDYARLLKTAYIVIKLADPDAQVMFGGLLYPNTRNFLAQVLNVYVNDPIAEDFGWFFDIMAIHNYADPWRSGWLTLYVRQTMVEFGFSRPIWLNETGVPVWDDYPGPLWDRERPRYASSEQQAYFLIQSAAYAWAEGAERVFYHQLYDDCGDQPAGTDFPVHNGELCTDDDVLCSGDAHGIFRNQPDSICFSQHPQPGTPRPVARGFRLMAEVFGREPFDNGKQEVIDDRFATLTFDRPRTGEHLTVVWNRTRQMATLELPAVGTSAQMISLNGDTIITPEADGAYRIILPPASSEGDRSDGPYGGMAIGGAPHILIEHPEADAIPQIIDLDGLAFVPLEIPAPGPTQPPAWPTTDPSLDVMPPVATVIELPPVSEPTFTVSWQGSDNSGIKEYLIWVRVDGGTWRPWIQAAARDGVIQTSAVYTGTPGSTYDFAAWAVDLAGNWSTNTDLQPQATTRVE